MTPLIINTNKKGAVKDIVVWKNNNSQSLCFNRPIQFELAEETTDLVRSTIKEIDGQISKLKIQHLNLANGKKLCAKFEFFMTMIDGKTLQAATNTKNSITCPTCVIENNDNIISYH